MGPSELGILAIFLGFGALMVVATVKVSKNRSDMYYDPEPDIQDEFEIEYELDNDSSDAQELEESYISSYSATEDQIVERWSQLLIGLSGLSNEWLKRVETELKAKKFPYRYEISRVRDSRSKDGIQKLLICYLDGKHICSIGSVVIGNDLHVNWAICDDTDSFWRNLPIIGGIIRWFAHKRSFATANRLAASASVTFHAAFLAAEKIMDEKMLDKGSLNRKSSGKLGPL